MGGLLAATHPALETNNTPSPPLSLALPAGKELFKALVKGPQVPKALGGTAGGGGCGGGDCAQPAAAGGAGEGKHSW